MLVLLALMLSACGRKDTVRSVYHWKTAFDPTQYELDFLHEHQVQRLYLRLFDVDLNQDGEPVPIATTRFMQPLPDDIEVVPVVYITNEAIGCNISFYEVMVERVMKMAECNGFEVKELQVDCDWTESNRYDFKWFCEGLKELLHEKGIRLSATVRLWQIDSTLAQLPADATTLMLYNTGDLRSAKTRNSILDYKDAKPYLQRMKSSMMESMSVAWPLYGWGVAFDEAGQFTNLVSSAAMGSDNSGRLRIEWGEMEQMRLARQALPDKPREVILYHLDSLNLSRYSYEDIEELFEH